MSVAELFVAPAAVVAASASFVRIFDDHDSIDIRLDRQFDPMELAECIMLGLSEFARFIDEDASTIAAAFRGTCLATLTRASRPAVAGTVRLATALHSNESPTRTGALIFTATEAFWPGSDQTLSTKAFRLFVSGLSNPRRCHAYASLIGGANIAIAGDMPDPNSLTRAMTVVHEYGSGQPLVVDLVTCKASGVLKSPIDAWTGVGKRLSIVQTGRGHTWKTDQGSSIYWVSGRTVFPNLSSLPPLDDKRAAEIDYPRVSGVDTDRDVAKLKCLAEGVERFAGGDVRGTELHRNSAFSLTGRWLDPRAVILYAPAHAERLGVAEFSPEEPDWWVIGENCDGEVWLPAALTFYPFGDAPRWLQPSAVSSNGMAAYTDTENSRLRAWLELVERDAFQRLRLRGPIDPPDRLSPKSLPAAERDLFDTAASIAQVTMLLLPSPTSTPVVLVRADTTDGLALGMAAAGSVPVAAGKAITEALVQVHHPFVHRIDAEQVDTPGDHAALYAHPPWRRRLDWMLDGELVDVERDDTVAIQMSTTACWYQFPVEHPSLVVSRVIDPSLIPLTFGFDTDPTGHADFAALMAAAGLDPSVPLDPHPFA